MYVAHNYGFDDRKLKESISRSYRLIPKIRKPETNRRSNDAVMMISIEKTLLQC
jgi:hypothetical protein